MLPTGMIAEAASSLRFVLAPDVSFTKLDKTCERRQS